MHPRFMTGDQASSDLETLFGAATDSSATDTTGIQAEHLPRLGPPQHGVGPGISGGRFASFPPDSDSPAHRCGATGVLCPSQWIGVG